MQEGTTMSRFNTSPAAPVLTGITLLVVMTLSLPGMGLAQSAIPPERALLNAGRFSPAQAVPAVATGVIDGERALLNHFAAGTGVTPVPVALRSESPVVDGAHALMGRRPSR
jgi:hypothetical protein